MKNTKSLSPHSRFQTQYPNYRLETSTKEVLTTHHARIVLSILRNELGEELLRHSMPIGPYEDIESMKRLVEAMLIEKFFEEN
jgi:hypothetical protein